MDMEDETSYDLSGLNINLVKSENSYWEGG